MLIQFIVCNLLKIIEILLHLQDYSLRVKSYCISKKNKVQKTTTRQGEDIKKKLFLEQILFYPFDIQKVVLHIKRSNLDDEKEVHEC